MTTGALRQDDGRRPLCGAASELRRGSEEESSCGVRQKVCSGLNVKSCR